VEPYIRQCLESIYTQDVPLDTYEVIVVNDGTPDGSMNIVDDFSEYINLNIINQENKGLSIARNVGLQNASGDFIWFVDSDDWIEKNVLLNIYALFDKYAANVEVFITPMRYSNTGKNDISVPDNIILKGKDYLFTDMPFGASQRFIFKRSFLLKYDLKFMPNVFHEDGEFNVRMLCAVKKVYVMRDSVYNYRFRTSGSIMSSWKKKNSEDLIYIYKNLKLFCMNSVDGSYNRSMFSIVTFNILFCSIAFAKGNWDNLEFRRFYEDHKNYIRVEALHLLNFFTFKNKGLKFFCKLLFIYVTPLFGVKGTMCYSNLKSKIKKCINS
jgi:glycosyltransferase involved in cell wall biosynthesis